MSSNDATESRSSGAYRGILTKNGSKYLGVVTDAEGFSFNVELSQVRRGDDVCLAVVMTSGAVPAAYIAAMDYLPIDGG